MVYNIFVLICTGQVANYFTSLIINIYNVLGSFLHILIYIKYYIQLLIWRKNQKVFWFLQATQPGSPLIGVSFTLEQEVELILLDLSWVVTNLTNSGFFRQSWAGIATSLNSDFQAPQSNFCHDLLLYKLQVFFNVGRGGIKVLEFYKCS